MCDDPLAADIEPEPWHTGEDEKLRRVQAILEADEAEERACADYVIHLVGCDDSTVFIKSLTYKEYLLLQRLSEITRQVSTYGCMPRMDVTPVTNQKQKECFDCY